MDTLTDAEREVLRLLACGLGYQDIARIRGSAMRTVQSHCYYIYAKLYVDSQLEAARWAWQHGIITIDEAWSTLMAYKNGALC